MTENGACLSVSSVETVATFLKGAQRKTSKNFQDFKDVMRARNGGDHFVRQLTVLHTSDERESAHSITRPKRRKRN